MNGTYIGLFGFGYWVIGCIVNALVAREKGRSMIGVIICSILFSPTPAYLYLLAVPSKA